MDIARKYRLDKEGLPKIIRQILQDGIQETGQMALPPQPIVGTASGLMTISQWRKITMPPQPDVDPEEAAQLAHWILSLNQ